MHAVESKTCVPSLRACIMPLSNENILTVMQFMAIALNCGNCMDNKTKLCIPAG